MTSASSDAVDWELDVTDAPLLHCLAYVFPSVLGGVAVLAGGLLIWLVAAAVRAGDPGRAVALVALALLGLLSRRYLPALLATSAPEAFVSRYSRRGLVAGSLLGAAVLLGSVRLHPNAPFAVFVASWLPLVLTAGFPTTGHADPASATLVVDGTEIPVDTVRRVRTGAVGAVVVCWLSYARGVPSAPRLIAVPAASVAAVERTLDAAPADRRASTVDRPTRLVAGAFGLGMLAVGPILWFVLPPGDGRAIALYAGALFGLVGVLVLWYAYSA